MLVETAINDGQAFQRLGRDLPDVDEAAIVNCQNFQCRAGSKIKKAVI
jgi:hypothetical protein